ncbi:Methylated-DNA--protein-cysteine methyltransferase [Burkholderiales bacterium]|nr:MAG: methylated-DNA--[protein]-cysteine S-methyltransferase [Burkholderiales bacterium]CAG1008513.1 Methylated-DNA--protein-cysteine methyltransferase [Burkholderiales bacterium]
MTNAYSAVMTAPFGVLGLVVRGEALAGVDFLPAATPLVPARDALTREAVRQLGAYFENPRFAFDVPLLIAGTEFQKRVWALMCAIPVGAAKSYGEAARDLKSAARAVGGACGANPLAIVIPCHRIVAARGLGGFMGRTVDDTLKIKRWLLQHEGYPGVN